MAKYLNFGQNYLKHLIEKFSNDVSIVHGINISRHEIELKENMVLFRQTLSKLKSIRWVYPENDIKGLI